MGALFNALILTIAILTVGKSFEYDGVAERVYNSTPTFGHHWVDIV
jgi:hypothetical protein